MGRCRRARAGEYVQIRAGRMMNYSFNVGVSPQRLPGELAVNHNYLH
jgi:hypothetical protein